MITAEWTEIVKKSGGYAGLPGAQLIILTLKSKGLSESASIVARVYLPSYILSIITIAAWSSIGLMISVPREDGTSFCKR